MNMTSLSYCAYCFLVEVLLQGFLNGLSTLIRRFYLKSCFSFFYHRPLTALVALIGTGLYKKSFYNGFTFFRHQEVDHSFILPFALNKTHSTFRLELNGQYGFIGHIIRHMELTANPTIMKTGRSVAEKKKKKEGQMNLLHRKKRTGISSNCEVVLKIKTTYLIQ